MSLLAGIYALLMRNVLRDLLVPLIRPGAARELVLYPKFAVILYVDAMKTAIIVLLIVLFRVLVVMGHVVAMKIAPHVLSIARVEVESAARGAALSQNALMGIYATTTIPVQMIPAAIRGAAMPIVTIIP